MWYEISVLILVILSCIKSHIALNLIKFPDWRMPDFVKFSGDDERTTWEHISQYTALLGEAGALNALEVRLFPLSLTGTTFAWF